uniref:Ycf54 n=1 Tax=Rhodymenia pseudopalmata TaxID=31502 RepID=A0A1C9C7P5_RHOPU|nr:hypothetical protein Rhodyp_121 [Rhodymenia pseudopalmata]AOM64399.1 hypothetical protein Rhodyp_121 [Rhodymenia pseudopalmata]
MYNYYFAIASKNFLMNQEPLEEILRERTDHYKSINKAIDFWLILNPAFLNSPDLEYIAKQLKSPSAAIVSFDKQFIQWLKLRIGFVAIGNFQSKQMIKAEQ